MRVKAKLLGAKAENRVVGWDGFLKRRVREGDEFEIPDDTVEVIDKTTGEKVTKSRYFSDRWMEPVDGAKKPDTVVVHKRNRVGSDKSSGDKDVI